MTAGAICRGCDVRAGFASGRCAVVTGRANGGCGECAVIDLGSSPTGSGLVATFAGCGGRKMGAGFTGCTGSVVAAHTLRADRNILVEQTRIPAGIAPFMAGVAIGNGYASQ